VEICSFRHPAAQRGCNVGYQVLTGRLVWRNYDIAEVLTVCLNSGSGSQAGNHQGMVKPVNNALMDNLPEISEINHHPVPGMVRIIYRLPGNSHVKNI